MKTCNICGRISATDSDHTDCIQKRRIETEDEGLKEGLPEKLDMAKNADDLGIEIRAILDHMTRENAENQKKARTD